MSLSAGQKTYLATLSVKDQEELNGMAVSSCKDIIKSMMGDDDVGGKTNPTPKRDASALSIISSWTISGDFNGCLVCANEDFVKSTYDYLCKGPCNLFVKQTHEDGDPLPCKTCRQDMAPMVFFWGRADEDDGKVYCHARKADCHGETVAGGACGLCKRQADSLIKLNRVGEDGGGNTCCKKCFSMSRASELRKCQPAAIEKRNNNPFNTPKKKPRKS